MKIRRAILKYEVYQEGRWVKKYVSINPTKKRGDTPLGEIAVVTESRKRVTEYGEES